MSETRENKSNSNLAIVVFFGLTVSLICVFLSARGADVGRLPQFSSGLFSGDLFSSAGFVNSLLGLLIAFLIAAAWFGLGKLITRVFDKDESFNALNLSRNCAVGAAVWSLIWFSLGLLGGYSKFTAVAALITGLSLAVYFALKYQRS